MTFTQKIIAAAFTLAAVAGTAGAASAAGNYSMVPNAGIPGYNQETHTGISVQSCLQLCTGRGWCKSADYERAKGKCFLQPVNKRQKSLRTDYPGNPYDHYHRPETLVEHGTLKPAAPARAKPAPVKTAQTTGQCGQRVSITGVGATGLVYNLKKNRAERRAKRAWRGFIAGESGPSIFMNFGNTANMPSYGLGTRYADLGKARNVVMNCKGGGTMRCTITATPCAY